MRVCVRGKEEPMPLGVFSCVHHNHVNPIPIFPLPSPYPVPGRILLLT